MSAPQGSGDPSENEADVDLKGVIKDLQDEIKALNKLLQTFGKGIQGTNKVTKMGVNDHLRLIKAQGEMVKSNADYKKSLQNSISSMDMFTGMLTKGVSPLLLFSIVGKKIGGLSTELDAMKSTAKEFAEFEDKTGIYSEKSDEFANAKQEDKEAYIAKQAKAIEAAATYEKVKGGKGKQGMDSAISSFKEFAEKHKTGFLIGAGSSVVLITILKKALSASPMFQQMMKLLNFGIMMVLRPIGDFFGFLFRPILIMLLRKFIIPWYTKMYPVMMKMGNIIGEKLSGAFEALAKGDVATAFAILFADVDFKQILVDMTQGIRDWIENTDWEQVKKDIMAALTALGLGLWTYVLEPLGQWAYDELKAWWDDGIASITASWNDYWDSVYKWFDDGVTGITTAWSDFWDSVYNWFDDGITGAVVTWTSFFTSIKDWFVTGITNAGVVWTNFWDMIKDAIWTAVTGLGGGNNNNNDNNNDNNNNNNSYDHMTGGRPTMHGGLIEEPIMGIGRSGRRYMFGEAGTEVVTPMNEISGSGSITINIQNMSGSQQDLNNLRQVILDVIQQSSARRGRA